MVVSLNSSLESNKEEEEGVRGGGCADGVRALGGDGVRAAQALSQPRVQRATASL